jgi:hypothetical protein
MLARLQRRFLNEGFPHEIGLFLGYPPEDVRGFIFNKGQNFICCRYWKVYHNAERAMEMFRKIDKAQILAMNILAEPLPARVAARRLGRVTQ